MTLEERIDAVWTESLPETDEQAIESIKKYSENLRQSAIEQICELLMQVDSDSQFHQLSDCLADIQGVCEEYLGE